MSEEILVVGAGPTGLALAIHLALHHVPVRVIDAAPGPATTSRALGLQSRGIEVLERIRGLGDLRQRSRSLLTMYYNDGPKTRLTLHVGRAVAGLPKPTLLISQAAVEGVLRERLAELGVSVEWSTRLVDIVQTGERVTAHCLVSGAAAAEEEQAIEVAWLIGCDGAHSAVRHLAGIEFPGTQLIDRLLMIDAKADWPYDPDGSVTWMDTNRMLSVSALPDGVWRIFVEPGVEVPKNLTEDQIVEHVVAEFTRRSELPPSSITEVQWATEFRIHRRLAERYRRGRVLIAGDAAHIQSPSGGQGQNTGLGDAENLGWKLAMVAAGRADLRLLDSYEQERRPLAAKVLAATSRAVGIMLPDRHWKRMLRDLVVMPAFRIPALQRRLWQIASQLNISYRRGPLAARSSRFASRPRAGDRMPDLLCQDADGADSPVHAALDGRWAVIAADQNTADRQRAAVTALLGQDQVITLVPVTPWSGDAVLVRPDGHVGWRGKPADARLQPWVKETLWPR